MSIDVEEWFHILDLDTVKPIEAWDLYEPRAKMIIPKILSILKDSKSTATFFFLGWLAERNPRLVEMVLEGGHEIGSHGYSHQMISNQSRIEFAADLKKSTNILKDITGQDILGYRAPGFSLTHDTLWALETLIDQGYAYDSSIFPTYRNHGGYPSMSRTPFKFECKNGSIVEFPSSVINFGLLKFSFFGGGYFRLAPIELTKYFTSFLAENEGYVSLYIHPRDMDPGQPRLMMSRLRRLRSYVNISSTELKLKKCLINTPSCSFEEHLQLMEKNLPIYSFDFDS